MSLFGALFASLSLLTPQLWFLYALFAILGLIGPGTSAVPHASLISRWFTARRGLALGVMMCGTGTGGIIWPITGQELIDRVGWRASYHHRAIRRRARPGADGRGV
jgi:MFS family permease